MLTPIAATERSSLPVQQETATQDTDILSFPITADTSLAVALQDTLVRVCGSALTSLTIEAVPQKHQSRLWLVLQAPVFGVALHAVITGIPQAELGPVTHLHVPAETRYAA
jgi:hypothetical protein